jgi:hypothetical protein
MPRRLHKAHNKLVAKKRTQDELLRAEVLIQKLKDQKAYAKDKQAFSVSVSPMATSR